MEETGRGIKSHRDLVVWQQGMILVDDIYLVTAKFPSTELYGITSQIRRAAMSVPANVAEGFGLGTDPQLARHLRLAYGSLMEVDTFVAIAQRQGYLTAEKTNELTNSIAKIAQLINGFQRHLKNRRHENTPE